MKDKKKWAIGILCTLVCIMAVGYAVLAQQLNITGTTSIDSTWKVEITNIHEKEVVGKAVSKVTPSYTSTTANFSVGLTQPGDSITYEVEISNLGTLKAKVDSININLDENDAIKYTTSGVNNGDKLGVGEKTTLTIKVEYDSNVTSQPSITSKDITLTINCVQDLDDGNATTTYQTYSIGDQITFAGSNWYVIKNSSSEEDYVTLLKAKVLTLDELGDYATSTDGTTGFIQFYGFPYGNIDYGNSKVKEFYDNKYLSAIGEENLKEVDGYKIRLLNEADFSNLGLDCSSAESLTKYSWIGNDFGESASSQYFPSYFTMIKSGEDTVFSIMNGHDGVVCINSYVAINSVPIRPVINLLKSSVQ